jgi:hypothetical protein
MEEPIERRTAMHDPAMRRLNEEVYRRINTETRADPSSPFANKYVGLVNGEVVVVSDDLGTVDRRLRELDPGNNGSFVFEASRDPNEVYRV